IYAIALRISIDQVLGPVALGTAARLHPVVIIFCFLAGGVLFGLPGIILAVPVALTVRTALSVLRAEANGLR
ncbi:MAG: AI-2E family transporter, partial [Methylovirgula sp.]